MKKKWNWSQIVLAAATVALLASGSILFAAKGGGGKPPKDDPPPPSPVIYALHRFTLPNDYLGGIWSINQMNDVGELVGYYDDGFVVGGRQPFYFDANSGYTVATNLNDVLFDVAFPVPDDCYIYAARGINNLGDIACALALKTDPEQRRGCVIEMRPDPLDSEVKPRIHLIPDNLWSQTYVTHINDVGVVLGKGNSETAYVFQAPLHGQLGDGSVTLVPGNFRVFYTHVYLTNPVNGGPTLVKAVTSGTEEILTYNVNTGVSSFFDISNIGSVRGFNDLESFCGQYKNYLRKRRYEIRGFSFVNGVFQGLDDMEFAENLNNDEDVVGLAPNNRHPVLYHPTHGSFLLHDVVVAETDVEQAIWENSGYHRFPAVSNRNESGFPVVAGTMNVGSGYYDGYVLFPMTP